MAIILVTCCILLYVVECVSLPQAGISVPLDDIKECFKFVSLGEKLKAVGVKEEHEKRTYPMPKSDGKRYAGLYTDVRAMIQPPLKSAFQELKEELEEIAHAKGRSAPTSHYLLPSRDIYEKTYGISTKSDNLPQWKSWITTTVRFNYKVK
ncbi:uncharacterized protein LOC126194263 [Schistocerca nitens]|uniref:uncharacterized protein LOC126194263 n=1 Tax=Schistocerca nitens TaxID=7011 RepID=UPI002119AC52|nr:uncharacterized protein LOC126194263 [Schistocerca nitens]